MRPRLNWLRRIAWALLALCGRCPGCLCRVDAYAPTRDADGWTWCLECFFELRRPERDARKKRPP